MIREQFFEDANGFGAYRNKADFMQAWKFVLDFEKETEKSLDSGLTQEEYYDLFNTMRIRHLSVFYNRKTAIMFYIKYLVNHDVLPKSQEDMISSIELSSLSIKDSKHVIYFKNIAMLKEAIDTTVYEADPYDPQIFDVPISILYLAWYGLTEDQIINLRKSDVTESGIILNGIHIIMDGFVVNMLEQLRDSEGYYQQARGRILRKYVYSDYLIRSDRKHQIDLNGLRGILARMNNYSGRRFSLRYDVAYRSGVFYRAYLRECNGVHFDLEDPKCASEIFGENLNVRSKLIATTREYDFYKQLFS